MGRKREKGGFSENLGEKQRNRDGICRIDGMKDVRFCFALL